MSVLLKVALASLRYRLGGVLLTVFAVALSVFVLLGVEQLRRDVRASFASTVAGVDLIVGARTSDVGLLLLSVFRIGSATANVPWEAVEDISRQEQVSWVVPLSLGDSHRGFRVVATTGEFFDRYRYARQVALSLREGRRFAGVDELVLGAEAARALAYVIGDQLVLSHGVARTSFQQHDQLPFRVVGILERTGTPIDNALFVGLDAVDAIHGDAAHEDDGDHDHASEEERSVTALLLGLDTPVASFQVQRWINEYREAPLLAILPGVALAQLWQIVGGVETALLAISVVVFVASLCGLNAMLMASLRERRREIEILRSVGAPALFIVSLLVIEALAIVTLGILLAFVALLGTIAVVNGYLAARLGIALSWQVLGPSSLLALALIYLSALLLSLLPAWRAYRMSRVFGAPPV